MAAREYTIDFTKVNSQPPNWTLADQAVVKYGGSNGAEFTFAKRTDAPYIWTSFYMLFGRVEITVQAAPGQGMITGAVLMSDIHDEIDWEWSGSNFNSNTGKVQTNYFGKGITGNYDRGTQPAVDSPTAKFHTYVIDWTPDEIVWSIDSNVVRTQKSSGADAGAYQHPQTPSRLHLGIWNGGDKDTNPGVVHWAGGYTDMSKVPYTAYFKSVKISTPNPCSSWEFPAGFSGKWQDVKCTNQTLTPPVKNLPCTYNVTTGDYGYGIAQKLGIPFPDLEKANQPINWDKLELGKTLKVPGGNCSQGAGTVPPPSNQDSPFKNGTNQVLNTTVAAPSTTPPFANTTTPYQNTTTAAFGNTSVPITTTPTSASSSVSSASSTSAASMAQYICQKGDYGHAIAQKLGCSFDDLEKANPNVDWDKLFIGQVLNYPKPVSSGISSIPFANSTSATLTSGTTTSVVASTTTPIQTIYMVAKGDYCEKIIEKLQCNQAEFTKANPGIDCNKVTVSQPITVPTNAPSCSVCNVNTANMNTTTTNTMTNVHTATVTGSTDVKPVGSNATSCYTYTVAKGDYGVKIAESFGITFAELEKANPGINWDKLWIGTVLKIPGMPTKKPASGVGSRIGCQQFDNSGKLCGSHGNSDIYNDAQDDISVDNTCFTTS
ncbi:uncharacterized protein HMPREF1541_00376 [Cyphellophora europaea CBS 101466]|uniref:GH16 domain-containing protein n=1 Tax=Cyphellophora europaea (strain CBS 101466) TaxID=1220924 RepID=W2SBV8_CYPE1|nr:uncharacterized protein HMPREF1541_00376 [Cyphellophora europaea CBS 101466]ETN46192.1 hypothetical protein HMPREF1541_00376 [Cyphellophora europaea CBS 101466]